MLPGKEFTAKVKEYYSFLISEFDFKISKETIIGQFFYQIIYQKYETFISISYENAEDYFLVTINSKPLADFTKNTFDKVNELALKENSLQFANYSQNNELDRKLFKSAKDLRLVIFANEIN